MAAKIESDAHNDKFSQSVKVEAGASAKNITQITNIYTDSDTGRLQQELITANERRWHERYETLRSKANSGYFEVVRNPIADIVAEIEQYETKEAPINTELKARIYRLAAVSHLPRYTNGKPQRCSEYLSKAEALSENDDLLQCHITQALLRFDLGDADTALEALSSIPTDEALRLRFSIYVETNQIDRCQQFIDDGSVSPAWRYTNANWCRATMGFYTVAGNKEAAQETAEILVRQAPTASSHEIAAHSLLRLANTRFRMFCQTYDIFPEFYLGLDLGDLIDHELQFQAAKLFAKAGELYEQHDCRQNAIHMYNNAIHLCLDEEGNKEHLVEWVTALTRLDPQNSLLIILKSPEFNLAEVTHLPLTLLDFASLVNEPSAAPAHVLKMAGTVADTEARAIEVADILEKQIERFQDVSEEFAYYVFTVLRLWQQGKNVNRALIWLEHVRSYLPHPRLEPLFHIWLYSEQGQFDLAAEWLTKVEDVMPEHPEILAAGFVVHHNLQNYHQAFHCAQKLFVLVRTRRSVAQYLAALWNANQFEEILDLLASVDDVRLSERYIRENRARTLIRLSRITDARDDLEWIRSNGLAHSFHLLHLSGSYQLLGDEDQAVTVLRECIHKFPDEVEAYLDLSHAYLHAGQSGKSFASALKAAQTFPDDPRTALHLWFISHPTGNELLPEVGDALRAFLPGGRFAEQSPFIPISIDELPTMVRDWQEKGVDITKVYRAGNITWLMLSLWRNVSPFQAHYEMSPYGGMMRYIAHGEQLQDIARLMGNCPRNIVLDYTAWLSMWFLFGSNILTVLSRYFERVFMPSALRHLLLDEQNRLATFGQLAHYQAQCAVRDALIRWVSKVIWHEEVNVEQGRDLSGSHTEKAVAKENNLVYLNEHLSPNEPTPETAIGIVALADLLAEAGEIDSIVQDFLKQNKHPIREQELHLISQLKDARQLVVNISTVVTWAMYGNVNALFGYLDQIHLVRPAYDRLLNEIAAYEFGRDTREAFREMRHLIYQGEETGLIVFESIPAAEYSIRQAFLKEQGIDSDEDMRLNPTEQMLFDYCDELIGIATRRDLPIWTDDRLTKVFNINNRRPPFTFGTDSFLAFAHNFPGTAERISPENYHTYYGRLVDWGYYFLPINPEHILWHLQQGRDVRSKPLASLFQHYRNSVIGFWEVARNAPDVREKYGRQLLGAYQGQLVVTMYRLYAENISVDVGAAIFAELDLSRHAGTLILGNEPMLFASLFIAITAEVTFTEEKNEGRLSDKRLLDYSHWLNQVILHSAVPAEVLEEAWYQLIRYPLAMLDEGEDTVQRQVSLLYLDQILNVTPLPIIKYLLSSDIGHQLREEIGLELQELVTFQVAQEIGGTLEFRLPLQDWNRDLQLAIGELLADPTKDTIVVGLVTLKAKPVASGSIFLQSQVIPTEAYTQYPNLHVPAETICILPGFNSPYALHRKTLWEFGLTSLESHQLSTDDWMAMEKVYLEESDEGMQLGNVMRHRLLGKWPIAREFLAQAAQLNPNSVMLLLASIEPIVVREWLQMPSFDWTSANDLVSWASQIPSSIDLASYETNPVQILIPFGYSIFLDVPILRHRLLSQLLDLTGTVQHEIIQQLIKVAEESVSLALKANVVLIVRDWLNGREMTVPHQDEGLSGYEERLDILISRILQGSAVEESYQTVMTQLQLLLCHWFYETWSQADTHFHEELVYLAYVGAGFIIDTLSTHSQISLGTAESVIHGLVSDLRSRPINSRPEPQLFGFFDPALGSSLNYTASYLLHGLLKTDVHLVGYHAKPLIRDVALQCGVSHRTQQAFLGSNEWELSWLDSELVQDIGSACVEILGILNESETQDWSDLDRARMAIAASEDRVKEIAQQMTRGIAMQETEAEVLSSVTTLFQGRIHPTSVWYETISVVFESEVIEKIRAFAQCYAEVVANLCLMWVRENAGCPPELLAQIRDFLLEVPTGDNAGELIKPKAYVFSKLLHSGLDTDLVCKWIKKVADSDQLDQPTVRLAFRPFILAWPEFEQEIRRPLFSILSQIAATSSYKGLWEFNRLIRTQHQLEADVS
ncbi:MAG: tetratricopeptide repeat protein [Anaerolineae bacterium]|nr:tetratricopeptide repeat protein [Anaerolineae bacterium]